MSGIVLVLGGASSATIQILQTPNSKLPTRPKIVLLFTPPSTSLIDYHQTVLDLRSPNNDKWQLLAAKDYQFAS